MLQQVSADAIKDSIKVFIKENFFLGDEADHYGDGDSFLEKGIVDSTGILELVSFVEGKFGIKVQDEELTPDNLDSVSRLASYVKRKMTYGRQ
jgi:acyl carrier protein